MNAVRLVLALAALTLGCSWLGGPASPGRPPETGDGWQTAAPEDLGMDPASLLELMDLIDSTEHHLWHSVLIVKDQKLVFERYWPGTDLDPWTGAMTEKDFGPETLHYAASVSKSVTSALVGIAIDRGYIGGVGDSLFSYFPDYGDLKRPDNGGMLLRHLLSFTSGYDWNEHVYGFDDPRDSHYQMFHAADPFAYLLERTTVSEPGNKFLYNSGDANLMGEIVRRASRSDNLVTFAYRYFFQPLGIESFDWMRYPQAGWMTFASGGASLRPRDMAKLGQLYLNGGAWQGRRIVSQAWVDASTRMAVPLVGEYRTLYGYGYNWWLGRSPLGNREIEYFRARGWGGQDVYVYPELGLVLVFTAGGYYESRAFDLNDIIEQYIFRALPR
jgi:CubicO group peptidase (beta-lactamase class C family)